MAFAVTHVLVPILFLKIMRDDVLKIDKKILTDKHLLLAGVAGLFPDIDIVVEGIFFFAYGRELRWLHRTVTHSFYVPLILFIATCIIYKAKKRRWFLISAMVTTGIAFHLVLDFGLPDNLYPDLYPALDAVILLYWLIHEELHNKIKSFF